MVSQSRHREKSKPVHQLLHTGPRTLSCLWSWSPTVEQTNIEALNAKNFIHWFNFKVNLENCCWISLLCTAVYYVKHNSPCIVSSPGIWPSDDLCIRGMTSCSPQLLVMFPIQKLELILKLQLNHLTCKKSDIQQTCGVIRLFIHLQATANLILLHTFGLSVLASLSTFSMAVRVSNPPTTLQQRKNTTRPSFYTLPSPDKGPLMPTFARKRIVSVIKHIMKM